MLKIEAAAESSRSGEGRYQPPVSGRCFAQSDSEDQFGPEIDACDAFLSRAGRLAIRLLLCLTVAGHGTAVLAAATWSPKQSMPAARYASAFAVTNGKFYVFGGRVGESIFSDSYAYDPGTNSWSVLASMPAPRGSGNGGGVINGKIYIPGGVTLGSPNFVSNDLLEYDPATNNWTSKASMPTPSACGATEAINGKLYVVTGCDGSSVFRNWLHVWDPSNNFWTQLADSPVARASAASAVINSKLYLVGGVGNSGQLMPDLTVYDPAANTWQSLAPLTTPRTAPGAAVINGKLYVIGGAAASGITDVVEVYDPATNAWSTETLMPTARFQMSIGSINDVAYVAGGLPTGSPFSAVSVLESMSVGVADTAAPTTLANAAPAPNAAGWNDSNVTVTLSATDNTGGSGVQSISYVITNGASSSGTSVSGASTSFTVSAEGVNTISYHAVDNAGNVEATKTLVVRIDKTPPTASLTVSPSVLWPPNHKLVSVTPTLNASDPGGGPVTVSGPVVTSSEPVTGRGDKTSPDWVVSGNLVQLRAERNTRGPSRTTGRVYTLTYVVTDQAGNSTTASATVTVPHNVKHDRRDERDRDDDEHDD